MLIKITQARLTVEELHQLKWLIGSFLALVSLWALGTLDLANRNLIQLAYIAVSLALIKPEWIHSIPSGIWSRLAAPLILVAALLDFGLRLIDFFPPLVRLIILLLIYRALAPRNQREDLQILLLSLFGIVVSGTLTASPLFALQMLLFTPVAMAFLLIICLLDREPEIANYCPDWRKFHWGKLINRIQSVFNFRVFALGTFLFACVVILSTAFFILIPRFDLGQAASFLQIGTKSVTGFSDTVQLDSVSEIVEDHSIVLRIDVPGIEAIRSTPYWRVLALDQYSNGTFQLSSSASKLRKDTKLRELTEWGTLTADQTKYRTGKQWTFYFEGGVSQYLPLPGLFCSMRFPKTQNLELLPDLYVVGLNAVQQNTFSYQIEDLIWNLRTPASQLEKERLHEYLNSGKSGNHTVDYPLTTLELALKPDERVRLAKLNHELKNGVLNMPAAQYSRNVTTYLRDRFRYSLKSNHANGADDPVLSWLEKGSSGHCELFAGAFVLLARDAGYPARMVVGFVGGSWNAVEDFFVVRNSNAHAWAEIYDVQTESWLRVDPTPGQSATDPEIPMLTSFELETGMAAWVDSLRMQWYRRIINFDYDDQTKIATSVGNLSDTFLKSFISWVQKTNASLLEWISHPFRRDSILAGSIAVTFCLLILFLWRKRFYWLHFLCNFTKKSQALSPIRRQSSQYLRKLKVKISEPRAKESSDKTLQNMRTELEALRFGPDVSAQFANPVFKKARRILHKRKYY